LCFLRGRSGCAIEYPHYQKQDIVVDAMGRVRWVENRSSTTDENATLPAKLLKQARATHIYLITHFRHMHRAQAVFEKYDLKITPSPMDFYKRNEFHQEWSFRADFVLHQVIINKIKRMDKTCQTKISTQGLKIKSLLKILSIA